MLPQPPYLNLEYIYYQVYLFLTGDLAWSSVTSWVTRVLGVITVIGLVLTPLALAAIVWITYKIYRLRTGESELLAAMLAHKQEEGKSPQRAKWERVMSSLQSTNSADWKLAIIEADNMLDELVQSLRYPGENLGERLKSVEPSDFTTLQDAWDAHKVRNQIAHDNSFVLSEREAKLALERYGRVFDEFKYLDS